MKAPLKTALKTRHLGMLTAALAFSASVHAEIVLKDDTGHTLRLNAPAQRIIALAPHITETLFAAGAGPQIVGAVEYSDYPPQARQIPRVGGYSRIDLEAVVALKPDLVLAWESGNSMVQAEKLRALGLNVFVTQPNRMPDIARLIESYGTLAGTGAVARPAADAFRQRMQRLQAAQQGKPPVRVFYQIWKSPLMTVGANQIISDAIRLCGGENVFGQLKQMAPRVSLESVLEADPEAIIATGMGDARPEWLDDWRRWTQMQAVRSNNLFHINPDLLQRHTPRILEGAEKLCAHLDTARARRK